MAVDRTIQEAVLASVREAGQPDQLAKKLLAWLEAIASGNEELTDLEAAQRHLELLFGAVEITASDLE
jgi:hypothetical protein